MVIPAYALLYELNPCTELEDLVENANKSMETWKRYEESEEDRKIYKGLQPVKPRAAKVSRWQQLQSKPPT
jgi:hypothetical protein